MKEIALYVLDIAQNSITANATVLEVALSETADAITFTIADNGKGMSPELLAQVSDLVPGELVHVIADAHIYDRHVPIIEKMLAQTPSSAPVFRMDPSVTDFYAFTRDSFSLEDYIPAPFEDQIPIAI